MPSPTQNTGGNVNTGGANVQTTTATPPANPAPAPLDPSQSTLSPNFASYVYDMLSRTQGLMDTNYMPYRGDRYAGPSRLQREAFQGIAGLETPRAFDQATALARRAGREAEGFSYAPGQFGVDVGGTGFGGLGYNAGQFGVDVGGTGFGNLGFDAATYNTGLGTLGSTADYMNPYTQNVTDILAREATREADIRRQADQARLAKAGAYGGGRQAIIDAERSRNLATQIGDIREKGLASAYDQAQRQRLEEAKMGMEAQRLSDLSRQFGAGYGLDIEKAAEEARQYRSTLGFNAQKAAEEARQFASTYGLDVEKEQELARQFRAGLDFKAQQEAEGSRQFGATTGLDALAKQLEAARTMTAAGTAESDTQRAISDLMLKAGATQRDITQAEKDFRYQQWQESQQYPYKQLQFMSSMLQGLPVTANQYSAGGNEMLEMLRGIMAVLGISEAAGSD
jgi:hypothetical protein